LRVFAFVIVGGESRMKKWRLFVGSDSFGVFCARKLLENRFVMWFGYWGDWRLRNGRRSVTEEELLFVEY
jgi:hypothetical protein